MNQGERPAGQATAKLTIVVLALVLLSAAGLWIAQRRIPSLAPAGQSATSTPKEIDQIDQAKEAELQKTGSFDESKLGQVLPVRLADDKDHVWGSLSAKAVMIVYDDFECPFCADYYDTVEKAKTEFGDQLAVVFRHAPILNIHPYALKAAEASECAAEQGKFWEMYRQLFADNKAGRMYDKQFKDDAKTIGLDQAKFNQCFDTGKYKEKVLSQMVEAKTFNVNGTPTTFINGEIVVGANPYEDLVASDGRKIEGLKNIISRQLQK
jgi:protein-disulfide isomerase